MDFQGILALAVTQGGTARRYGAEMVVNGTFNTDLTGWSALLAPTTFVQTAGRMRVANDGAARGLIGQSTPFMSVTAGTTYFYSMDVEVVGLGAAVSINQSNYNALRQLIASDQAPGTYTLSGDFTAPFTETVHIIADFASGSAREMYFDNVSFRPVL